MEGNKKVTISLVFVGAMVMLFVLFGACLLSVVGG